MPAPFNRDDLLADHALRGSAWCRRYSDRVDAWISPDAPGADAEEFIRSVEVREVDDFVLGTEVSPRVNSVKNDDPSCLDSPPAPEPPRGQGSLF